MKPEKSTGLAANTNQLVITVDPNCAIVSPRPGTSASPSQVPPGFFSEIDSTVIESSDATPDDCILSK